MNTKGMIVSIVTAMLVMTMFASSAMAITVDGEINPSDEWDGDWSADDSTSGDPCDTEDHLMEDWGYNMKTVYQHYDKPSNTLYFRLDVCGMPADLDGDGDVNDPCNPPQPPCDCDGVGAYEQYEIQLTSIGYSGVNMRYADNDVVQPDADAQWGADCIEFSLINADTYVDPYDYCMFLSAGGIADPPSSEDLMDACHFDDTPKAEFDFTPTECGGGMLDASASSDDVEIVSWDWDFCDDGTGDYDDASGESVSYACPGTCNVGLKVTDNLGQTGTIRHDVNVAGGPVVQVTTDADGCVDIGAMVEFSIDSLTHDTPIASYQWTFNDGLTGSSDTSPTTSRTIPTNNGVTATLTVTDTLGCVGVDHVSVCVKPTQQVPFLTPVGMVALIGMLCIVGAGRILTKGRRS